MTAAELILKKALVASNLDSKEWNTIQAALRNRAFFSSCIAEANILQAMRHRAAEYAARGVDISEARKQMRADLERMHYAPKEGEEGTIKDLFSEARLNVILKHNLDQARGMIQRASGMTPGAFAAFPALEFKRIHHRKNKRTTWAERWRKAGGKIYGGKMIALKTDPVWIKISVFGNPFPPFDWGSGMGVIDVDRKTAIEIGLVSDEKLREETAALRNQRSEASKFNDNLQASVSPSKGNTEYLKRKFGDLVKLDGDSVKWRAEVLNETLLQKKDFSIDLGVPQSGMLSKLSADPKLQDFATAIKGKQLTVDQTWRDIKRREGGTHLRHFKPTEKELRLHPEDPPLSPEEMEMLPTIWHNPDRVIKLGNNKFLAELDAFDGSTFMMQIAIQADGPKLWTFFKTFLPTSKKIKASLKGTPSGVHP